METLWTETTAEELLKLIDELPECTEIVKGKTDLLGVLVGFDGIEISENSPRLSN